MVRKRPLAWISLVVVFAVTALTGCGSASPLAAQVVPANLQSAQTAQNAPATSAPAAGTQQAISSDVITSLEAALEQVYANVSPSVVYIQVRQAATAAQNFPFGTPQSPNGTPQYQYGSGSGFVWDMSGDIVTNNHVVDGADQIMVTFSDGTTVPATVVGTNVDSDLAVIHVDVASSLLHPVTMGDSALVKVGEVAIAIGNPYGLESTMTVGFISGLGRSLPVQSSSNSSGPTYSIPDVIQTDAPINPGNSGGVLLNDLGQVVGVTAAIESASGASAGIGFVIPSAIVDKVVPSLIDHGSYAVPYLGISGTTLDNQLAAAMNLDPNQHGVLVADVAAGGPAAQGGLLGSTTTATIDGQQVQVGGDVIVAIDGHNLQTFEDLVAYLWDSTQVGQQVTLTVLRNGQSQQIDVTLQARPGTQVATAPQTTQGETNQSAWLGITGTTLSADIATAMGLPQNQQGVLVDDTVAGSPADLAGLQGSGTTATIGGQSVRIGGDVIVGWDNTTVTDYQQLQGLVAAAQPGQTVTLHILRNGSSMTLQAQLSARPTS